MARKYGDSESGKLGNKMYCPAFCAGRLATPVPRSIGKLTAVLPAEWLKSTPENAPSDTNAITHLHTNAFHLYALLPVTLLHLDKASKLTLPSTSVTFLRGTRGFYSYAHHPLYAHHWCLYHPIPSTTR